MPTTSVVNSTPMFVTGTFDAAMVRLATIGNVLPGLFASGHFAVSQRAAGANQSVDIASGSAYCGSPTSANGMYLARSTASFNTLSDGAMTWTTSDPTNPRIDMVYLEVGDTSTYGNGASFNGVRFGIASGTPNASITHQLDAFYWPAVPNSNCIPLSVVLRPAAASTITTSQITNLNAVGGQRSVAIANSSTETTASTTYARLTTPDFVMLYAPTLVNVRYRAKWKISVASGTQAIALFVNGVQLTAPQNNGVGGTTAHGYNATLGIKNSWVGTSPGAGSAGGTSQSGFTSMSAATNDSGESGPGLFATPLGAASDIPGSIDIFTSGWTLIEAKFKTSANTLSVSARNLIAGAVG